MTTSTDTLPVMRELITEDDQLSYTQRMRHRMIEEMTDYGKTVPSDNKDRNTMLAALADMDKQTLGLKKIGSKEKMSAADREAASLLARMLNRMGGQDLLSSEVDETRAVPSLDEITLAPLEVVPGETDIGTITEDYDSFIARMEAKGS